MSAYRKGHGSAPAVEGREDGLVDELIRQFADPLAFFRELIQNSIDAGASRVAVTITFDPDPTGGEDAAGVLEVSVRDDGCGMDREVLEDQLTVLFRSGKEGQADKIGKFGVGFVSVLAIEPELVSVRTTEGEGTQWTLELRADQTYDLFRAEGGGSSGTTVTLRLKRRRSELTALVEGSERALRKWCRHAEIPVHFVASLGAAEILREARIDSPLGIDALVSVRIEEGGTIVVAGLPHDGQPYLGFFNRGLLLFETSKEVFGSVMVSIQDGRLEHTLSRDNVRRDAHHDRAMRLARRVVDRDLTREVHDVLRELANRSRAEPPIEALLTAAWNAGLDLDARAVRVPLLEPTPGLRVAVAWGSNASSTIVVRHWGLELQERELPGLVPVARFVVEDPALVPDVSFRRAVDQPEYPVREWNHALARTFVDALGGKQVPGLFLGPLDAIDARGAQTALLEWIARADEAEQVLGKARFARLRDVAFVRRLGCTGYATLAEVAVELGDGALEWVPLSEAAAVDLGDWHPVCSDETSVMAFAKILGRDTSNVLPRLVLRRRATRREHALQRHRARPPVDPAARWKGTQVEFKGKGVRAAAATFGKGPVGADVELLIESRPFCELRVEDVFPLRLVLDLPPSAADEDFAEVSDLGHRRIRAAVRAGARKLLDTTARSSPTSLTGAPDAYALLLAWSVRVALKGGNASDRKTLERLAAAPAFLTIQGDHVPLAKATTAGGTVRVARWEEPWLGADGDRPVLRLPAHDADAHRAMLGALTPGSAHKTRDVTNRVARLQAKRRVDRGLMQAPRLVGEYDPRFRYDLSELLDETEHAEALGVLGIGEVALSRSPKSKVTYAREGRSATLGLALVPAVHVAAQVPDAEAGARSVRKPLRAAVETLISLVVRRAIDDTPSDQLPTWLRERLRDASLVGGALHLTRLDDTPFFETSVGSYVSPAEALRQAKRFGAVWTTESKQELRPLDPTRIALRLDFVQTQQLDGYARAVVATDELLLDGEARRNQAQPPVTTLEPSAAVSGAALSVVTLEASDHTSHGSVALLRPGYERLRGGRVSRNYHPLGDLPDVETIWPVACRIDEPGLTPNRTWSEPVDDVVLVGLMSRITSAVYGAVAELTPIPQGKLAATRVTSAKDLSLPDGACVMGVVWLEDEPAPGSLHVSDPKGERTEASMDLAGRSLPLHGDLRVTVPLGEVRLRKLCVELCRRLLVQLTMVVEGRRGPRRDQTYDHLTRALRADVQLSDEVLSRVAVAGFVGDGPNTLAELRQHLASHGAVAVCAPAERAEAEEAALHAPLFVDDGSPAARSSLSLMADCAAPWRSTLQVDLTPPVFAPTEPVEKKARHPLAQAVLRRWRSLALPGVEDVRLDGRRKHPPIRWDGLTRIVLSKRHPVVRRALEALEEKSVDASSQVALLVAHAAGMRRRSGGNPSAIAERAMLRELMRELAMV